MNTPSIEEIEALLDEQVCKDLMREFDRLEDLIIDHPAMADVRNHNAFIRMIENMLKQVEKIEHPVEAATHAVKAYSAFLKSLEP